MIFKLWFSWYFVITICAKSTSRKKDLTASLRDTIELASSENPGSIGSITLSESQKEAVLQLHNAFRSMVKPSASNMLRMSWDKDLEKIATDFANKCIVAHNPDRHKLAKNYDWVGENIAWGTGTCGDKDCGDVYEGVKRWFSESKSYNYLTGQCSGKCTLYTQMVWWESNKLGCGAKKCGDRTILVCNYAPGGNYVGQRPYKTGKVCADCPADMGCEDNLCTEKKADEEKKDVTKIEDTGTSEPRVPVVVPDDLNLPTHPTPTMVTPRPTVVAASDAIVSTRPTVTETCCHTEPPLSTCCHKHPEASCCHEKNKACCESHTSNECCPPHIDCCRPPLPPGWIELPIRLTQIDSGITESVWGMNGKHSIYILSRNNMMSPVDGIMHHVTAGQAGVWAVGLLGNVFFRRGVSSQNDMEKGLYWEKIPGNLKQIDSGPYNIVWGVNRYNRIFCRIGIQSESTFRRDGIPSARPEGTGWMRVEGSMKYVSCGELGCWAVNKRDNIYFRAGVTSTVPQGTHWIVVPGRLRMIESGPGGVTIGLSDASDLFVREGVTIAKPDGIKWVKMDLKLAHVTVGARGIMGILPDGTVTVNQDLPSFVNTDQPTVAPTDSSGLATHNMPLDVSTLVLPTVPSRLPSTPTKLSATKVVNLADSLAALSQLSGPASSNVVSDREKLHITPDMASRILKLIEQKGNQFEDDHRAAAEASIKNISMANANAQIEQLVEAAKLKPQSLGDESKATSQRDNATSIHEPESEGPDRTDEKPLKVSPPSSTETVPPPGSNDSKSVEVPEVSPPQATPSTISPPAPPPSGSLPQVPPPSPSVPQQSAETIDSKPLNNLPQTPGTSSQDKPVEAKEENPPSHIDATGGSQKPSPLLTPTQPPTQTQHRLATRPPVTNAPPTKHTPTPVSGLANVPNHQGTRPQPDPVITGHKVMPDVTKVQGAPVKLQSGLVAGFPTRKPTYPTTHSNPSIGIHTKAVPVQPEEHRPVVTSINRPKTTPLSLVTKTFTKPRTHAHKHTTERFNVNVNLQNNAYPQPKFQPPVQQQHAKAPVTQPPTVLPPKRIANTKAPSLNTQTHKNWVHSVKPSGAPRTTSLVNMVSTQRIVTNSVNSGHKTVAAPPAPNPFPSSSFSGIQKDKNNLLKVISKHKVENQKQKDAASAVKTTISTPTENNGVVPVTVSWELTRSCCAIPDSVCPIPKDCIGYIECHGYHGNYKNCDRGKMFNPITNICDYPRNVDCESVKAGMAKNYNAKPTVTAPLAVTAISEKQSVEQASPQNAATDVIPHFVEAASHKAASQRDATTNQKSKTSDPAQPRLKHTRTDDDGVLREVWFGLGLSPLLTLLTNNPRFPTNPDEYIVLDKFEAPPNAGDGYGQRLSTYYKAPQTGEYVYYMSCDNECELWISPDTEEIHSNLILELKHGHYTSFRQWHKYPDEQTSRPIYLQQGEFYFMESFMKEGAGGDDLSIGVKLPNGEFDLPISKNLYLVPGDASAVAGRKPGQPVQIANDAYKTTQSQAPPLIPDTQKAEMAMPEQTNSAVSPYQMTPELMGPRPGQTAEQWIAMNNQGSKVQTYSGKTRNALLASIRNNPGNIPGVDDMYYNHRPDEQETFEQNKLLRTSVKRNKIASHRSNTTAIK